MRVEGRFFFGAQLHCDSGGVLRDLAIFSATLS